MITFLRRRGLGLGSIKGMVRHLEQLPVDSRLSNKKFSGSMSSYFRTDQCFTLPEDTLLVRWGCRTPIGHPTLMTLNQSQAIERVNNKAAFRMLLQQENSTLVPETMHTGGIRPEVEGSLVVRPTYHSQGRNLFVVNGMDELLNVVREQPSLRNGWYASKLIDKKAEYRVYVVSGKVATVARKTPSDPNAVAWNVAQGGRFDVVRWGDWPLEVCRVAVECFKLSGLDFSGVDVMVDQDDRPYVIELNSAPSLPSLSDGSVSYRQKVMANCFAYIKENGKGWLGSDNYYHDWRGVIHPSAHT